MEILTHPNRGLREKADPVKEIDETITSLVNGMVEAMFKAEGLGLAATQVGRPLNIFVMNVEDDFHVFLNPKLLDTSEKEETLEEGCLSVPGVNAEITRPDRVVVEGIDLDGNQFKLTREGTAARVIHHEMDHLRGVLFFDKLSEASRSLLLSEYEKKKSEGKRESSKEAF